MLSNEVWILLKLLWAQNIRRERNSFLREKLLSLALSHYIEAKKENLMEEIMAKSEWVKVKFYLDNGEGIDVFLEGLNLTDSSETYQNDTLLSRINDYRQVNPVVLVIGIFVLVSVMVLKSFFIIYERFEMDSMKRGFTNQMITNQFIWSWFLALILIIRFTLTLVSSDTLRSVAIGLAWLQQTCLIAICLSTLEATLFEYWSRLIIKRVPENDHDFIATGLCISNIVLSFYLATMQTIGLSAPIILLKIIRALIVLLCVL